MTSLNVVTTLSSNTILRVLSLIDAYGWFVYNSKYGYFIADKKCESMKEVMDSNYIGLKFLTSRAMRVVKKLEKNESSKKYNTLYDPRVMINKESVEVFTTENSVKFKNKLNSKETFDNVKLLNMQERTVW